MKTMFEVQNFVDAYKVIGLKATRETFFVKNEGAYIAVCPLAALAIYNGYHIGLEKEIGAVQFLANKFEYQPEEVWLLWEIIKGIDNGKNGIVLHSAKNHTLFKLGEDVWEACNGIN